MDILLIQLFLDKIMTSDIDFLWEHVWHHIFFQERKTGTKNLIHVYGLNLWLTGKLVRIFLKVALTFRPTRKKNETLRCTNRDQCVNGDLFPKTNSVTEFCEKRIGTISEGRVIINIASNIPNALQMAS